MSAVFGGITEIMPSKYGVVSGKLTLNTTTVYIVHPISYAIYMASNKDFISRSEKLPSDFMIECWNPMFVHEEDLKISDKLIDSHIIPFTMFILAMYTNLPVADRASYTGPPITSSSDIRRQFQAGEKLPALISTYPFIEVIQQCQ